MPWGDSHQIFERNSRLGKETELMLSWLTLICLTVLWSSCSLMIERRLKSSSGEAAVKGSLVQDSVTPVSMPGLEPLMSEVVHRVFERNCKRCHGPDGHGIAGVAPDYASRYASQCGRMGEISARPEEPPP